MRQTVDKRLIGCIVPIGKPTPHLHRITNTQGDDWYIATDIAGAQHKVPPDCVHANVDLTPAQKIITSMFTADRALRDRLALLAVLADGRVAHELILLVQVCSPRDHEALVDAIAATPGAPARLLDCLRNEQARNTVDKLLSVIMQRVFADDPGAMHEAAALCIAIMTGNNVRDNRIAAARALKRLQWAFDDDVIYLRYLLLLHDYDPIHAQPEHFWPHLDAQARDSSPTLDEIDLLADVGGERALPLLYDLLASRPDETMALRVTHAITRTLTPPEPESEAADDESNADASVADAPDGIAPDPEPRAAATRLVTFASGWDDDRDDAEREIERLRAEGWTFVSMTGGSTVTVLMTRDLPEPHDSTRQTVRETAPIEIQPVVPAIPENMPLVQAVKTYGADAVRRNLNAHAFEPLAELIEGVR